MECAGRGLHGVGIGADAVVRGDDDGIGTGAVACAGDGTEVADVRYAVEHDEERAFSLLKQRGDEVLDVLVGDSRYESHNALMVLEGDAVELLDRHALDGYLRASQGIEQLARQVALHVFLYEHAVDVLAGFDGFDDGADAEDIV